MNVYLHIQWPTDSLKIQIVTLHNLEFKKVQEQYNTKNVPGAIHFENSRTLKKKTLKKMKEQPFCNQFSIDNL